MIHAQTGVHVEVLEMDDLEKRVNAVTPAQLQAKEQEIRDTFEFAQQGRDKISMPVSPDSLTWSARVACGLDALVKDFDLQGLTYYHRGIDGNVYEQLGAGLIVGNSLLTARNIPCAGEGDLKTCLSMFIMDRFGAGGSFTEFYAMDFNENFVLMGHDGPMHIAISEGKPVLRGLGLFHGKRGYGLSVEAKSQIRTHHHTRHHSNGRGSLEVFGGRRRGHSRPDVSDWQHQLAAQIFTGAG